MLKLTIGTTDVFLEDCNEVGQGKITISNLSEGAYNHYWPAMGTDIKSFLLRINSDYFANKLCNTSMVFCPSLSIKSIRKHIRDHMKHELPWYKFMSGQKELREKLKELEHCDSEHHFIDELYTLHESLLCFDMDRHEEREFKGIIEDLFTCEPWYFIEKRYSNEYQWLKTFHSDLKKQLIKSQKHETHSNIS